MTVYVCECRGGAGGVEGGVGGRLRRSKRVKITCEEREVGGWCKKYSGPVAPSADHES